MRDDNDAEIVPNTKTTRTTVVINKTKRTGLIEKNKVTFPETKAGRRASIKAFNKGRKYTQGELLESLHHFEEFAQQIAQAEGCTKKSTLDSVAITTLIDGDVVEIGTKWAGTEAETGSLFEHAYNLEKNTSRLKKAIKAFEQVNEKDRHLFYKAIQIALGVGDDLMLLTIKQHEKDILRGSDSSYSHKGATETQQKEGAKRMQSLINSGHSQNSAAGIVATEQNKSRTTVKNWYQKHRTTKK